MRRLLTLVVGTLLLGVMLHSQQAFGGNKICLIKENWGTAAQRGIDTLAMRSLLYNLIYTDTLQIDIDAMAASPSTYTSAFFDTMGLVVTFGNQVETISPSGPLDSVANSRAPWVTMLPESWDECNLGTGGGGTVGRVITNDGYFLNLGSTNYPTRTSQDTLEMYKSDFGNFAVYGITFPDSLHDIKPLVIENGYAGDTSIVLLATADSGATVLNTNTSVSWDEVTKSRRAFIGLFSVQVATPLDSIIFYRIFERTCAWVRGDTLNDRVMKWKGFSGRFEIDDISPNENGAGDDSIETNGGKGSIYMGVDFDVRRSPKTYLKPNGKAIFRQFTNEFNSIEVDSAFLRLYHIAQTWDITPPPTWRTSIGWRPIKGYWVCGNALGDIVGAVTNCTYPYASWTYRWLDCTPNPDVYYPWAKGGADSAGVDYYDVGVQDSMVFTETSVTPAYITCALGPEDSLSLWLIDSLRCQGWTGDPLYWSTGTDHGVEEICASSNTATAIFRPKLIFHLSSYSLTSPQPTIALSPSHFDVTLAAGTSTIVKDTVRNSAAGSPAFAFSTSHTAAATWNTVACVGACISPDLVENSISAVSLSAGIYYDTVHVICAECTDTDEQYTITLTVTSAVSVPTETRVGVRRTERR